MSGETETCLVCGQPKSASAQGSLTQWIAVCQCGLTDQPHATSEEQISICATCGKRIPELHTGSFTQWVFRSQLCECDKPVAVDALKQPDRVSISSNQEIEHPKTGYLKLSKETFPIERYKPIKELGSGGGGSVYLCFDEHLDKYVSVKVLYNRSSANLVAFQKEAKVTARFKHPNVVSVIDFGVTEGGAPYMVLEYIDGVPLDSVIKTEGAVPEEIAVGLFVQIADALEHGHDEGIFHRDVKSSNILVAHDDSRTENVRIIDFGVAALLGSDQESTQFRGRTVVGTPKYMSPEQANGGRYDARSEIYSFGCVMFETLTGRTPFDDDTAINLLHMHANEPITAFEDILDEDIEVSEEMEAIVRKCLEKDPKNRYQNMESLKEALKKAQEELYARSGFDPPKEQTYEPMSNINTGRWLIIAACICALSLIPVAILILIQQSERIQTTEEIVKKEKKQARNYRLRERVELLNAEDSFDSREEKFEFIQLPFNKDGSRFFQAKAHSYVVDKDLKELQGRKDINAVNVHRCEIVGPGLKYLVDLPLEALDLNETPITDAALDDIEKMTKLRFLHLQGCLISDNALAKIEKLPLDRLGLGKTHITIEGLKHVAKIKTLRTLEMTETPKIDGKAIAVLHQLPHLNKIFASAYKDAPDDYYQELGSFKNTTLLMQGSAISLKHLAMLDTVGLGFRFVKMSKAHIGVLKKMKNLKMVEFWMASVTDDLMPEIAKLPLTEIALVQENISGKGLMELTKMKTLQRLMVQCKYIGPGEIQQLQKAMPNLHIETVWNNGLGEKG